MALSPKTCAVIAVDILQGANGDTVYGAQTNPTEQAYRAHALEIAQAARAAGVPVVFTCDAHLPGIDHELVLWGEHGMANTPAAQPAEFMEPQEGDYVIRKRRYDSFFETSLDLTLRELGVSSVVLIGCDTNICVAHTAAGAYYRNYDIYVASDATYTFLYGTQEGGLDLMKRLYDATILTSDEIVSLLGA